MRVTLGYFSVPEGRGNVSPSLVMAEGKFKDDSAVLQSREGGHNMVACILGSLLSALSLGRLNLKFIAIPV